MGCEAVRQDVAIKEMRCGHGVGILPDASLQRAMYEVKAGCGERRRQSECLPTAAAERIVDWWG